MSDRAVLQSIQDEYARYRTLAEHAIAQVSEAQYTTIVGDSSIAMYVTHMGGNLTSRFTDFLTTDGEKEWRQRDGEFQLKAITKTTSITCWNTGWTVLEQTIGSLRDSDLSRMVVIRKTELSVAAAFARSLAHAAYHVGQIVLLAKMQVGDSWKSLSIPRNQSLAYNDNPTLEKAPRKP